jgi:hypothetical protein
MRLVFFYTATVSEVMRNAKYRNCMNYFTRRVRRILPFFGAKDLRHNDTRGE